MKNFNVKFAQSKIVVSPNNHVKIQVFIGEFPEYYFTEDKATELQRAYSKKLEELEVELRDRNQKLELFKQYEFLIPGRVPRSIAI